MTVTEAALAKQFRPCSPYTACVLQGRQEGRVGVVSQISRAQSLLVVITFEEGPITWDVVRADHLARV